MAQVVDFPLRRPAAPPLDPEIRQTSNELVDVLQQLAYLKPSAVITLKRIAVGLLALYSQNGMH